MSEISRRVATALRTAIRREERTAATYSAKALSMQDEQAEKVLRSLAKQETGHARKLKRILDRRLDLSHLGRRKLTQKQSDGLRVRNSDVLSVEKSTETEKVLARAVRSEENSCRLYRSLENIFLGTDVAELFAKLAEEEEKHATRLKKVLAKRQTK